MWGPNFKHDRAVKQHASRLRKETEWPPHLSQRFYLAVRSLGPAFPFRKKQGRARQESRHRNFVPSHKGEHLATMQPG